MKRTLFARLRSPYLEIAIMVFSVVLAYFGLLVLSLVPESPTQHAMPTSSISWITFAFFLLSVAIAMISVIAGIGGGVIFTPIMLAFTTVNSLVVRGTGLIVAMFSGLISTGVFLKKGLGNYRLCMTLTLSQGVGALIGATLAVRSAETAGAMGEGLMRTGLGMILALIAVYFLIGGKKLEWPTVGRIDRFTRSLRLNGRFYEISEDALKEYEPARAPLGILLVFLVGLIGGFFGMGGGWAITPSLNMGMALPLKLAAANSGIILGIGSCISIWPYMAAGSIIPLFVLPWLAGQVIGGFIGSYALARIKVDVVRRIMIGIMVFTAFGLITKGLNVLGLIGNVPAIVQVLVFTAVFACVIVSVLIKKKKGATVEAGKPTAPVPDQPAQTNPLPDLSLPFSQHVYADIMHWVTIAVSLAALFLPIWILANPSSNVLDPNRIFGAIFSGSTPSDIWTLSQTGGFPGVHFYLEFLSSPDAWAQLAVCIGCAVGLLAVVPAVLIQIIREREWTDAFLGTVMAALIVCSMTGLF